MTTEIPKWAHDRLRTELPPEAELLNVTLIEKGRFKGSVLANTTRGAALVTKTSLGEPRVTFLPVPGKVQTVMCKRCGHRTEVQNAPASFELHCGRCGAAQRVHVDAATSTNGDGGQKTVATKS